MGNQKYAYSADWIRIFEDTFSITRHNGQSPYLIIEGEQPYKNSLGKRDLAVKVDNNYLNNRECSFYNGFVTIAFLVNDWIKIQDSLEMIFNLLAGDSSKGLSILSHLRSKKIPSLEFALYLCNYQRILLVNRFDSGGKSNLKKIKKLIGKLNSVVHVLIIGKRKSKSICNLQNVLSCNQVIHPSGFNFNTNSERYYKTWYEFSDEECNKIHNDMSLSLFHRLKTESP